MSIVSSMITLFMTVNSAMGSGKIDGSGSNFYKGECACGSGWVWSEETKECVKAPMS